MTEIERLISRHLDGELTPSEETRLRKLLVESADARALLREMTALGRAARRTPGLHVPGSGMEARLFQRLREEGLYQETPQALKTPVREEPARERGMMAWVRRGALAAAMLIAVIGGGYLLDDHQLPAGLSHAQSTVPAAPSLLADRGIRPAVPPVSLPETAPLAADRSFRSHSSGSAVRQEHRAPSAMTPSSVAASDTLARKNVAVLENPYDTSRSALAQANGDRPVALADEPVALDPPKFPTPPEEIRYIIPVKGNDGEGRWSAAVRGGIAALSTNGERVQEMNMRVGMQIEGGHRMALLVGTSPTMTETRYRNTGIAISAPTPSQLSSSNRSASQQQKASEYEQATSNETWLGVGYSYSLPLAEGFTLDPGVSAGIGNTSWRMGLELPVRYRIGDRLSMECAISASRIIARNAVADESVQVNIRNNYIYRSMTGQASFNSLGVQLGLRVDLGGE